MRRTLVEPDQLARHRIEPVARHHWRTLTMIETEKLVRLHAALTSDLTLDLSDVQLGIDDDELVVIGSVPAIEISVRLEEVAKTVDGIAHIDNQLVIRSTH